MPRRSKSLNLEAQSQPVSVCYVSGSNTYGSASANGWSARQTRFWETQEVRLQEGIQPGWSLQCWLMTKKNQRVQRTNSNGRLLMAVREQIKRRRKKTTNVIQHKSTKQTAQETRAEGRYCDIDSVNKRSFKSWPLEKGVVLCAGQTFTAVGSNVMCSGKKSYLLREGDRLIRDKDDDLSVE